MKKFLFNKSAKHQTDSRSGKRSLRSNPLKIKKSILFSFLAIVIGVLFIELITRGVFYAFGRYEGFSGAGWGYPTYVYTYRPYIGHAYKSFTGARDRYGFSLDSEDDPKRDLTKKNACEFRVFVLGGSTVLGRHLDEDEVGNSQDDTLPARLEKILNNLFSSRIEFEVINAGKPAYISVQTLMEHAFYIKYSFLPDYVVHFDGSNDSVGHPKYWPNEYYPGLSDNVHRYTEDIISKIDELTDIRGSLNGLLRNLANRSAFMFALHKTINDPTVWSRQMLDVDVSPGESGGLSMSEWVERHVNRYMYNVDLAVRLGDQKTRVAYILQPTMLAYMAPVLTDRENDFLDPGDYDTEFHGYSKRDSKQLYYFRVREEFEKLINRKTEFAIIADLSKLFDSKSPDEPYFGDYVHYLSKGRAVIAKEIAKVIRPSIELQLEQDPRFAQCNSGQ